MVVYGETYAEVLQPLKLAYGELRVVHHGSLRDLQLHALWGQTRLPQDLGETMGYTEEELVGKTDFEVCPNDLAERY